LTGRNERAPRRIPVEIHFGLVDIDGLVLVLGVSDPPALGDQAAFDDLRHEIRADVPPVMLPVIGMSELEISFVEDASRAEYRASRTWRASSERCGARNRREYRPPTMPRPIFIVGADIEDEAARAHSGSC
jgi:hypothetical protein